MVSGLRAGRITARSAHLPRRQRRGSTGRDHQGIRHAVEGSDPRDEPQLHRIQIPTDQATSMEQGE